jgi:two-component sensor histidine kinase
MVSGPDAPVGARAVTSLALALHETATNQAKYGAVSEPNGSIRVKWEARGGDLHFRWDEKGGPVIVAPPQAGGFCSVLAERSIVAQLRGKIEYDWRRDGLRMRVTVPLDRLEAASGARRINTSSEATVVPMFSLRALRLRANTG